MAIQRRILICYQFIIIYGSGWTLVNTEQKNSDNVHSDKKDVIEYRWSAWSEYTSCSRSCGSGIKYRHRDCYSIGNNTRKVSSKRCTGETKDYSTCNRKPCSENATNFRDLQCSFFDGRDSAGLLTRWKGITLSETDKKDCALMCSTVNLKDKLSKQFSEKVVDGTMCRGSGLCVDGICRSVGCDGILDSNKTRSKCGQCNSNNNTICNDISGRVRQQVIKGYTELLVLPKSSRYILVSEKPRSRVILAMKDREGIFFFSVQSVNNVTMASRIVAGTVFRYIKNNQSGNVIEIIKAKGPINETVTIMGFSRQEKATVALWYSYTNSSTEKTSDATDTTIEPYYPWQTLLHNNILQSDRLKKQAKESDSLNPTSSKPNNYQPKLKIRKNPTEKKKVTTKLENKQGSTRKSTSNVRKPKTSRKSKLPKKSNKVPKTKTTTERPNFETTTNKTEPQRKSMTTGIKKDKKGTAKLDKKKGSRKTTKQKVKLGHASSNRTIQIDNKPRYINSTKTTKTREQNSLSEARNIDTDRQELSIKVATKTKPESLAKIDMRMKPRKPGEIKFEWRGNKITPCSSTCKPGVSVTFFSCFRISTDQSVDDLFCDIDDKPNLSYHVCSRHACPPRWVAGEWGSCSLTCGEGVQQRQVKCWQLLAPGFDSSVHDYLCPNDTKPQQARKCKAILPCGPVWEMSEWSKCPVDCGYGWQVRNVRCNSHNEADCRPTTPRPIEKQVCIQKPCLNYWYTATWSECSGSCGVKHRKIFCRNKSGRVIDEGLCDINKKPLSVNLCGLGRCKHVWIPQEWRRCPVECGEGNSTRKIICGSVTGGNFKEGPDTYCHHMPRPPDKTSCSANPCGPLWYTTEWGECSKPCGDDAKRMREVKCYHENDISDHCFIESQPEDTQICDLPPCSRNKDIICMDDKRAGCDFLIKPSICERLYYRQVCCQTCHKHGY